MTTTTPAVTIRPRGAGRAGAMYGLALVGMICAWTVVRYVDQPYRSPTYRRGLLESLLSAACVAPIEGAGPLMPALLAALRPYHESFVWKAPLLGGLVYAAFACVLSRGGRRWRPLTHLACGVSWLMIGAIVLTRMTMK